MAILSPFFFKYFHENFIKIFVTTKNNFTAFPFFVQKFVLKFVLIFFPLSWLGWQYFDKTAIRSLKLRQFLTVTFPTYQNIHQKINQKMYKFFRNYFFVKFQLELGGHLHKYVVEICKIKRKYRIWKTRKILYRIVHFFI